MLFWKFKHICGQKPTFISYLHKEKSIKNNIYSEKKVGKWAERYNKGLIGTILIFGKYGLKYLKFA